MFINLGGERRRAYGWRALLGGEPMNALTMRPPRLMVDNVVILRLTINPTLKCQCPLQPIYKEGDGYANYGATAENSSVEERAIRCKDIV